MREDRLGGLRRWLARPDAKRLEVTLDPKAAASLGKLAAFGVSGADPEVANFYASRLLEQALEDLGDDPAQSLEKMPTREPRSPAVGDAAPDAVVLDSDGEPVNLKNLWAEQTTVLVFLRHYG